MDWKSQRKKTLGSAKRVVVKVGSAVLTGENGLDYGVVARLVDQLAMLHDQGYDFVLVSSGAVAAGRRYVKEKGADKERGGKLAVRQACSAVGQSRLMHAYDKLFEQFDKVTAQILLTRDDLKDNKRYLNILNTFDELLRLRVIPVVNENDCVAVDELVFGDNDALAGLLLNVVEADLFINLTTAEGVFSANPAENPDACFLDCIDDIAQMDLDGMCSGKTAVGTGGMHSKLLSAKRAAQIGVPTLIMSGRLRHGLERAFLGEDIGTWIMPDERTVPSRKFRLAYNAVPLGSLTVDDGAVRALTQRGKSLLPAGITEVEGEFDRGDLVRILDLRGDLVGVGLANYSVCEMQRIMGRKSSDIEALLGECAFEDAVHRDNMLLDAAVE